MQAQNLEGEYNEDSTHDTKEATVFATLGLPWRYPAYWITYDDEHPKSSGGIVRFNFGPSISYPFATLLKVYQSASADVTLDAWLDEKKADPRFKELIEELEPLFMHALVVYGRRFLENYRVLIRYLKEECPEVAHTKGTPVYNKQGSIVARQNMQIRQLPRLTKGATAK